MPALDPIILLSWSEESSGSVSELPKDLRNRLISLSYTDKTRGADDASIQLDNTDLSLFDDDRLAEGNLIVTQWGYPYDMGPRREFRITDITGWRTVNVKLASVRELAFIASEKNRVFSSTTASQVAETIAREMGFIREDQRIIEDGDYEIIHEGLVQAGETDFAFLQRLADLDDKVFRIVGDVFHFHPPRLDATPNITLIYFDEGGSFVDEPRIEKGTLGNPGRVVRRGHSPRNRASTTGEASNSTDTSRPTLGDIALIRDPNTHRWVEREVTRADLEQIQAQSSTSPSPAETDREATAHASRQFRASQRRAIEISGTIVGMPQLRADTVIKLEGVGQKLTGNYLVQEVTHKVGRGYTCDIKLKRDAESPSSAGRARGRRTATRTAQSYERERARLEARWRTGEITRDEYNEAKDALEERYRAASRDSSDRSQGRVNDREPAENGELQSRLYRDPETGRWRTRYSRPGGGSSTIAGEK